MEKEEVLRRSQNSYRKSDPYVNHLSNVGQLIGCGIALVVSTVIFFLQGFLLDEWNYALYATIPLLMAIKMAYVGIKARKISEIIQAAIVGTVAIAFLVMHLITIFGE